MKQLIFNSETFKGVRIQLEHGAITIGRANDNDVPIPDNAISSHHAKIFTYREASYIEDLNSTNGTYINGKRVQKHVLQVGDVIRVGNLDLEVTHP